MKNILLVVTVLSSSNALADGLHPKWCSQYFTDIDAYADAVAKKNGNANQAAAVKAQYETSKNSIKTLPSTTQEQMCTQGLESLKQVRKAAGL